MMNNTIRRRTVLEELDVKILPDGSQHVFSIVFDKKDGERLFFPRAIVTGLRFNASDNKMRGILAVDADNVAIGHVIPVHIDKIIKYNGMDVVYRNW